MVPGAESNPKRRVCEGTSQGGGSGRPIAEVHDHDMTHAGTGKSRCVVKH